MVNYHIAETLDEVLDRCEVILQTKTGFADYAIWRIPVAMRRTATGS